MMNEINIATMLTKLRAERGLTQEELAAALAVSNKTISKWENGASSPDLAMLAALAQYYQVSTDTLLGLNDEKRDWRKQMLAELGGMELREVGLKVFETLRATFPALYHAACTSENAAEGMTPILPAAESMPRSEVSTGSVWQFSICSDNVNLAVLQLKNRANFAWLKETEAQQSMARLLTFLADPDAMSMLAFICSEKCSVSFTAEYVAENAAIPVGKAVQLLDEFCAVSDCIKSTAHLSEGEVTLYESVGDGLLLSVLSLAYEKMCGQRGYNYKYGGSGRMIGGEQA
ncbi:MAG: helix-turn-helix transcriptional regulator [Clostridia bacterium]|nr:helix-turn-helix transcriptional regulator [Clostridia bacterium]